MQNFVTIEASTPGYTGWKTVSGTKMYFCYGILKLALDAEGKWVYPFITSKRGLEHADGLTELAVRARLRRGTIWFTT